MLGFVSMFSKDFEHFILLGLIFLLYDTLFFIEWKLTTQIIWVVGIVVTRGLFSIVCSFIYLFLWFWKYLYTWENINIIDILGSYNPHILIWCGGSILHGIKISKKMRKIFTATSLNLT